MRAIVLLRRWDYTRRFRKRHPEAMPPFRYVYLLHIGKTGGTFLKNHTKRPEKFAQEGRVIVSFGHNIKHHHLPAGSEFIFATRDPVTRFVSGFGSRYRRGPSGPKSWSAGEKRAFEAFPTAADLADALSSDTAELRRQAEAAMKAIRHVNEPQHEWFRDRDRLIGDIRAGRAHWIRQETLQEDVIATLRDIECPLSAEAIAGMAPVHAAPRPATPLSPKGEENIRRHYAADFEFLGMLAREFGSAHGESATDSR